MRNTEMILKKMTNELNNNPICKALVSEMAEKAENIGMTQEEWEQAKVGLLTPLFYKMAMEHDDIRDQVAEDVWNMFNN